MPRLTNCLPLFLVTTDTALTFFDRDWDRIKSPGADQIVAYNTLTKPKDSSNLSKLAVLKVNGGLGTSMGMHPLRLVEAPF